MYNLERTEHPRSNKFKMGYSNTNWKRVNSFNEYEVAKLACDDLNILDDGIYRVKRVYDSEILYAPDKKHEVAFQKKYKTKKWKK